MARVTSGDQVSGRECDGEEECSACGQGESARDHGLDILGLQKETGRGGGNGKGDLGVTGMAVGKGGGG